MELYFLRHGIAVERGTPGYKDDSARPLTPKGRKQLKKIAAAMRRLELDFDVILSSPHLRAKETAEIVAGRKRKELLAFCEALKPGGSVKNLVYQLGRMSHEKILLVGHEPDLSRLISLLIAGEEGITIDFKKAGLCKLEIVKIRHGRCATLAWLLTPGQMKCMR
jgi:phosphohistidine phosphatase